MGRHVVGGRLTNEWRFGVVRLWELSPEHLLTLGPGGAALVPLSQGVSLPLVAAASRKIQREAPLARQRAEGVAEGVAKGQAEEARRMCVQLARTLHPSVASCGW